MRLHRAPHRVMHETKRLYYRNRTSDPMLSQDLFRKKSDLSVFCAGDSIPSLTQLLNSQVIYCNSDHAEEFIGNFGREIKARVLLFGNSDRDFHDFSLSIPKSVKRIYLQNNFISDSMFHTLPIGIENLSIAMNGRSKFFKEAYIQKQKKPVALVGPFGITHSDRKIFLEGGWEGQYNIQTQTERLSPVRYAKLSSDFQFVLCPRGNGLDTHRFWETLYRGSTPIVMTSNWATSIESLGIPLLQVDEWTPDSLMRAISEVEYKFPAPKSLPVLWWDYWRREISDSLH